MLNLKRAAPKRDADQGAPEQRLGLGGALAGAPGPNRSLEQDRKRRWPWQRHHAQDAPGGSEWSGSSDLASKAFTVAMVSAMAAGPIALVLALGEDTPATVQTASGDTTKVSATVAASTRAGEEGLLTVRNWLASTRERQQIDHDGNLAWPAEATELTAPRVAQVTPAGKGHDKWQVTIAGTLPQGQEVYFAVPIEVHGKKASAVALPSVVPAPAGMEASVLAYDQQDIPLSSPLAGAAGDFLSAYLAGEDTTRFVSPGSHVPPVEASPWTSVRIAQVHAAIASGADATSERPDEGERARIRVRYLMQGPDGDRADGVPAEMSLSLTARGGRWEVTSVDLVPQLAPAPPKTSSPSGEADETQ